MLVLKASLWNNRRQLIFMPTLCFGGSFNPIHNAHLACAESVGRAKGYERVLLIPNAQSPLKPDAVAMAQASERLAMCRLAADYANQHAGQAQPLVRLEVDDIEMRPPAPSYTLDTARLLVQNKDSIPSTGSSGPTC